MCGKCTRSGPGSSFQWETASESSTKVNWDDWKSGRAEDLMTLNVSQCCLSSHVVFSHVCIFVFSIGSSFL